MRNPNGYGGISVLGGNRRRPFRVRITTGWDYDEKTGIQKQKFATLGYYATRKEAMIALAEYNKNPYDLDRNSVTFDDVYTRLTAEIFPKMSISSIRTYKAAYKQLAPLHGAKITSLKKRELQAALDALADMSESSQTKAKTLIKGVFNYCMENDLIEKDYSKFLKINVPEEKENIHTIYTMEEIKTLWDNLNTPIPFEYSKKDVRDIFPADLILIAIYTGMRPGEVLQIKCENVHLEERYMIGGFKTAAGTNRIIPLHDDIFPLVKKRIETGGVWLVPYKSDNPPTMNQFRNFYFDPFMEKVGLVHLPHDGRHTFATYADRSDAKPHIIKLIMGHKTGDITKDVYTHISIADMVEAVNKIIFLEK